MSRRRAFTIVEILMVLPILVIALTISARLFRDVILTDSASAATSNQYSRTDAAVFQLRQDVWASAAIAISNPNEAQLTLSDDEKIVWRIQADGSASRSDSSSHALRWDSAADGWTFSKNQSSLIIIATAKNQTQTLQLISQILAGGNRR